MSTTRPARLDDRVTRLERQVFFGWTIAGVLALLLLAGQVLPSRAATSSGQDAATVAELRARRLVIEDDQGRPRLVLAAPIAALDGRRRDDPAAGLLILDERGVDRVVIGAPTTDPQVKGEVGPRIGPACGINFNDRNGNERGGLGIIDHDDRVVLGLDREAGEGVVLFVAPDYSGLLINGPGGSASQRAFLGTNAAGDRTVFNIDDHRSKRRFQITVAPDASPKLEFYDEAMDPVVTIPDPDDWPAFELPSPGDGD